MFRILKVFRYTPQNLFVVVFFFFLNLKKNIATSCFLKEIGKNQVIYPIRTKFSELLHELIELCTDSFIIEKLN